MFGVGSMILCAYLGGDRGARGAGSAKATRGLGGSELGDGAVSGLRGRGMVVALGLGGIMFARSFGEALVGGIMGFGGTSSRGCWIGATGAGPQMGGMVGCSGCSRGSDCGRGVLSAFMVELDVAAGLRKVPAALTLSKMMLLVDVTGVPCCGVVVVAVDVAFGAGVSFLVL